MTDDTILINVHSISTNKLDEVVQEVQEEQTGTSTEENKTEVTENETTKQEKQKMIVQLTKKNPKRRNNYSQ